MFLLAPGAFLSLAPRVGNKMGPSAMEMEMVTRVLMKKDPVKGLLLSRTIWSFHLLWGHVGGLNGDISILASLMWLLDIGGGVVGRGEAGL